MNVSDFRKYIAKLGKALKGHEGAIVRGIHSGLMRSIVVVQQSTMDAFPASPNGAVGAVNTGAYRQAWQTELKPTGGRLFNSKPYAPIIEDGRRPNRKRPPIKEIELWAMRRLGLSKAEAATAKYAIANAIAKRGLAGRKVLTSKITTNTITRLTLEEIKREVHAALQRGKGP